MKNTTQQLVLVIATAIASSTLTILVGIFCAIVYIIQPFQKDAVDRGFATWEVTNNATGSTKFTWNEFATTLHPENPDNVLADMEIQ